ncbi:MAG: porin [Thiohalomonadales bacterium]
MKQVHKKTIKQLAISTLSAIAISGIIMPAQAANWLALQGTERDGAAPRAKLWGFIQAQYQQDFSDPFVNPAGKELYIPPKLIGPNLKSQSQFNVNRARVGVRGIAMPLDSNVNYFFLAEFGRNAITEAHGGPAHITDSSITLNHIKGARIRLGLFKSPIAEEALQAIHVFDYINFTSVTNQLLLERFPVSADQSAVPGAQPIPGSNLNRYSTPVGAFRDVGVQIFEIFKIGKWEHSYAVKYGNGNGLNFGDNDNNKDLYLYWSSERVYKGKGGRRQGLKMFVWNVDGKRTDAFNSSLEQDRKRYGAGIKYLLKPFRVTAEYIAGEGMIFQGQQNPGSNFNDRDAQGYYLDFGWYIPNTKFEIDLRYDSYVRGQGVVSATDDESTYDTATIGMQYHFNKKTRLNAEYSDRSFKSDTKNTNNQLEGVGGRLALQVTTIF